MKSGERVTGNGERRIRFRHIIYRIYRIGKDELMKKMCKIKRSDYGFKWPS